MSRHQLCPYNSIEELIEKHSELFQEGLGIPKGVTGRIYLNADAKPSFLSQGHYPMPCTMRIIKSWTISGQLVSFSLPNSQTGFPLLSHRWNQIVRICRDYKVTITCVAKLDTSPLPRTEDLYASLSGGKAFTKFNLSNLYLQIPLENRSKPCVTINTPNGLFHYNYLPLAVLAALGIFQRAMDNIFQGMPHVNIYLDKILITGESESEHLQNVERVLKKWLMQVYIWRSVFTLLK